MAIQHENLSSLLARVKDAIAKGVGPYAWVRAEVSEMGVNHAGHCFMELIDKPEGKDTVVAKARATIWANVFRMVSAYFETATGQCLQKGMKILVKVSVDFHEVYGLSLNITDIDPAFTVGEQEMQRRNVIKKLEQEGVIDMNKMLELPVVLQRLAVISSETAAGYGDFLHQLTCNTRGYKFRTTLFPCVMQGVRTSESIVEALDAIYQQEDEFDAVVIIRGGGSKSDLAWFDSYDLAINIAQFPLPVLVGIGHERDQSVADLVAHHSLKTPTAVAEFVVEKAALFDDKLTALLSDFDDNVSDILGRQRVFLEGIGTALQMQTKKIFHDSDLTMQRCVNRLSEKTGKIFMLNNQQVGRSIHVVRYSVSTQVMKQNNNINKLVARLRSSCSTLSASKIHQVELIEEKARLLDPLRVLAQGYSITLSAHGKLIRSVDACSKGQTIFTRLLDGTIESVVRGKQPEVDAGHSS